MIAEFVGELAMYALLAVLAGLLLLSIRGLDVLLQRHLLVGAIVLTLIAAAFVYGLVWSVRVRPGLYLEHIKDPARAAILGTERRRPRKAGMAFMQIACASVVGYAMTVILWDRP
jgi:hypothetical protein